MRVLVCILIASSAILAAPANAAKARQQAIVYCSPHSQPHHHHGHTPHKRWGG
ncbi:MAG: hypothetical protein JO249_26025 [Acidobacteria bacterium]|nr:hypothetical protein [Acidobacteriota bacterium]